MWGDDIKNVFQQNETILGEIPSFIDGLILWQKEPEISKYIDKNDYIDGLYFQFYGGLI